MQALRIAVWCVIATIVTGAIALATKRPYIFPSLGPTAIMVFAQPDAQVARPRNVVGGHAIGALCGYFALWATGLLGVPFSPQVTLHRLAAATIALGLTALLMYVLHFEHPPAGATTLIVALGVLPPRTHPAKSARHARRRAAEHEDR
jgi:CBS-domain-containing membrane protein